MIWHRHRYRNIELGSGKISASSATRLSEIGIDALTVFARSRELSDELPTDVDECLMNACPDSGGLRLESSRRLLTVGGDKDELSLYAVQMCQVGLGYVLNIPNMEPQFVTQLRNGCYSVTQQYRVQPGGRFDVYVYGITANGVVGMSVTLEREEHVAVIGENGYYVCCRSLRGLPQVESMRCRLI